MNVDVDLLLDKFIFTKWQYIILSYIDFISSAFIVLLKISYRHSKCHFIINNEVWK